jgi:hypothetical protein
MKLVVQYKEVLYYEEVVDIHPDTFNDVMISLTKEWDANPEVHEYYDNDFDKYLKKNIGNETNLTEFLSFSPRCIVDSDNFEYEVTDITQD